MDGVEFPYVHDLRRLRDLLPASWPVGPSPTALQRVDRMGRGIPVSGRLADLTVDDAERAEAQARAVYDSVVDEFGRRGVSVE